LFERDTNCSARRSGHGIKDGSLLGPAAALAPLSDPCLATHEGEALNNDGINKMAPYAMIVYMVAKLEAGAVTGYGKQLAQMQRTCVPNEQTGNGEGSHPQPTKA